MGCTSLALYPSLFIKMMFTIVSSHAVEAVELVLFNSVFHVS